MPGRLTDTLAHLLLFYFSMFQYLILLYEFHPVSLIDFNTSNSINPSSIKILNLDEHR